MKKRTKQKNNFISKQFLSVAIGVLLIATIGFFVVANSELSPITGNVVCSLGESRQWGSCTRPGCFAGTNTQTCSRGIFGNYWKTTVRCTNLVSYCGSLGCKSSTSFECNPATCVDLGKSAANSNLCCSGSSSGGKCCVASGQAPPENYGASSCCSGKLKNGKCAIALGSTGCSTSIPCVAGTCTNGKCCTVNGQYTTLGASTCCSGFKDSSNKCATCAPTTFSDYTCKGTISTKKNNCGVVDTKDCASSGGTCIENANRCKVAASSCIYTDGQCISYSYCQKSPGCNCVSGICEYDYGQQYCARRCRNSKGCTSSGSSC